MKETDSFTPYVFSISDGNTKQYLERKKKKKKNRWDLLIQLSQFDAMNNKIIHIVKLIFDLSCTL